MFKVGVVCLTTQAAASALRGGPAGARNDLHDVLEKKNYKMIRSFKNFILQILLFFKYY